MIAVPAASDASALAALCRETFAEAYTGMSYYTEQLVADYNAEFFTDAAVARDLSDPRQRFWVWREGGELAGYAKIIEKAPHEVPPCVGAEPPALYLQRLYLLRRFHRRGIGSALLAAVHREAQARGYGRLWLTSWEENRPAIDFYRKLGFVRAGSCEWAFTSEGQRIVDIDWVFTIAVHAFDAAPGPAPGPLS